LRVPSLAYPDKLLADVITARHLSALALIEQMDHDKFLGRLRCAALSGAEENACTEEAARVTLEAVLIEYALNGTDAFRYSISSAEAIGAMQFTNRNGSGTYKSVTRICAKAKLERDFERGATDLHNAMKAAACLLDIELAALPKEVRDLYARDPRLGGLYPVAAYNEGGGGALELFRRIEREGIDLASIPEGVLELPESVFRRCRCGAMKGGRVNGETYLYIRKYFYVWEWLSSTGQKKTP